MNIFKVHNQIISDYKSYIESFLLIKDQRIKNVVNKELSGGKLWPEPLIQFNPTFEKGTSISELVKHNIIDHRLNDVFRGYDLYKHQVEAIKKGVEGKSFIVTSGTGSGKSLTFLATIFSDLLKNEYTAGIKAILVYPMNALINSQEQEIEKYAANYLKHTGNEFPLTFAKYTGQEAGNDRINIRETPPDILLTNYMMLELMMTRASENSMRASIFKNLKYLVYDELHTYRGRQGADVSLLNRRIHASTQNEIICVGTSATMASGGTILEQKQTIANVGKQIFDKNFDTSQIIGEYLENTTNSKFINLGELKKALREDIDFNDKPEKFISSPIAVWLENRIALNVLDDGYVQRAKPLTLQDIASKLSEDSGYDLSLCKDKLVQFLQWTEALNEEASKMENRKSYLPFKFHQFIAQTGNVSVTLDNPANREITLDNTLYIRDEKTNEELHVYPVLFSRYSGHEFICVKKEYDSGKLLPRLPSDLPQKISKQSLKGNKELGTKKRELGWLDFPDGYILFDNGSDIWSDDKIIDLPETWKTKSDETKLDNFYETKIPQQIWIDKKGNFTENEDKSKQLAWFIPCHLLLDPTSGVIFDSKIHEFTKLMRLGNEGRSTATTITALSTIKALNEQGLDASLQKLLSFTDNRQDASLQSGHFNDFISTVQLRSAIYYALKETPEGLNASNIANRAAIMLNLKELEYARRPADNPKYPDEKNKEMLEEYLFTRIIYDLRRGWRYNTPNLEQCALLKIDYKTIDQLARDDDEWQNILLLNNLSFEERLDILNQIITYFRTSYALDHRKLEDTKRAELANEIKDRLKTDSNWCLDENEKIEAPVTLIPRGVGKTPYGIEVAGCGHLSALGKYFKRQFIKHMGELPFRGDELSDYMVQIYEIMKSAQILHNIEIKGSRGTVQGYRLRLDQVVWKLGDEKTVEIDKVRINAIEEIEIAPNKYFQNYYKVNYSSLNKNIYGAEHTGQLPSAERQQREIDFRAGKISALFCSPTMELGIDISSMNVVHMRNVPPGPANYAQRSGRAGRSGQTALVMTYCSNSSPHDRNYFQNASEMVAGVVAAPKLDLSNQELIESHLNAYIFMELGLTQVKTSVAEILNLEQTHELPVKEEIKTYILNQIQEKKHIWIAQFKKTLVNILPELEQSTWYSEKKLEIQAIKYFEHLDNSFKRWRELYRNANRLIEKARIAMDDPSIKSGGQVKKNANRDHFLAQRQRELLLNDTANYSSQSEFYIFRYLAAEGFLPGYNFTRLPVRTFIGNRDKGEFISRPRFIALKEFGPNNLIYHMGNKYRVNRMMLNDTENVLHKLKISKTTGYVFLDQEGVSINNDPITNLELNTDERVEMKSNILELSESQTKLMERISSQEEERASSGYDIEQYFSFSGGIRNTQKCQLSYDGDLLLELRYGPSARLLQLNRKWRRSKPGDENGYNIGLNTGFWKNPSEEEKEPEKDPIKRVHVYATDIADVLYIQPVKTLGLDEDGVITLTYAIKRAIEKEFQIEESELGAWNMGSGEHANILLFEAAESSLGVLSELTKNPDKLKKVFAEAYKTCYYNPETREDDKPEALRASYDDLLSYYNQRHHEIIDRTLIKKPLELLMDASVEISKNEQQNYHKQFEFLKAAYDKNSTTELKFIQYLYNKGLALPDKAQYNLKEYYISADFVYDNVDVGTQTFVFVDGSVHDKEEVKEKDRKQRGLLADAGYDVIVWRYDQNLDEAIANRKDIFRKVIENE
ncbi:DEAD/DEAH box helicase [Flavobacterium frigoris]|uniref:Helicase conserved C-terminal domain-containing protein n=1 Tax=Flavobacterium frigoris TaxID=229204 RepID=A0A1H9I0C8_FLAFI|nr:DEAD/DEAH box helicase [Flavobacterium frigoris]SEQ67885.1 Helicase conserved C-terminal domain-containing protein [Flavobacterium frigoris]